MMKAAMSSDVEIILFYNQTKIGVDLFDQRCSNYTTARRTRRWPLAVFYRLLDVSASNCYVVSLSAQAQGQKIDSRFKFMKWLAEQLTRPQMERRESNVNIQQDIRITLRRILHCGNGSTPPALPGGSSSEDILASRKNCSTYDPKKNRRTQYMCFECKKPICIECSQNMCIHCRENL